MTKYEKMFYGMASLIVALIGSTSCEYLGITGYLIYIGIIGAVSFFASAILEDRKDENDENNEKSNK